ncbi:MAG TPA: hypothetical protein VJA22_01365 [Patescibacteria group bacterium]|nr:hypothetical protein [Patescibacteria group bacterium]
MTQAFFISLEGGDAAGKTTQLPLLVSALQKKGSVATLDFPDYQHSVFGHDIGMFLRPDSPFGDFKGVHPRLASLPYMCERWERRDEIIAAMQHDFVVSNRYTTSNSIYQGAKLPKHERAEYFAWLEEREYDVIKLPKPNLVLFLYIPFEVAQRLLLNKQQRSYLKAGQKKDQHEQDPEYQRRVIDCGVDLCKERENWILIDGCEGNPNPMDPQYIHGKIMKVVHEAIGRFATDRSALMIDDARGM